jgi:hypothetical protein
MAHDLTDADSYAATVKVPDEGDDATAESIEDAAQALANRTNHHEIDLAFLFTGGRTATDGAKHVRRVANIAALQAINGGSGLNGECAIVDAIGLYVYSNSDATAADGNWIVAPGSGGGRWRHVLFSLLNAAQGIPRLDVSTKVPVAQLTNRLVSVDVNEQSIGAAPGSAFASRSATSFADMGSATYQLDVTTVAGDILIIDVIVLVKTANSTETGEVKLVVDGNSKLLLPFAYNDDKHTILNFHQKFVATDASTNIKLQWRSVAGDGVDAFEPFMIRCQVFRP